MVGLGNSGVFRPAAAFPDFTQRKREAEPAQETIQAVLGGGLGLRQENITKCPKATPDLRVTRALTWPRAARDRADCSEGCRPGRSPLPEGVHSSASVLRRSTARIIFELVLDNLPTYGMSRAKLQNSTQTEKLL